MSSKETMTYETQERYRTFYYLDKVEHLAYGQAHNVVANGNKQIEPNTIVVNYARNTDKSRWYAQIGIATGDVSSKSSTDVWPEWQNKDATLFEVIWVSKIVEIPAELFANQRMKLPLTDCRDVVNFALKVSR